MNKKVATILIILLLLFSSIAIASAEGLVVALPNIDVNKSQGTIFQTPITIINNYTKTMNNISFESNSYMSIPIINDLDPNEEITVNITFDHDNSFEGIIKLKGFFQNSVGKPFDDYPISVDYTSGLSSCSFSIIEEDSITWTNLVSDDIVAKNAVTGEDAFTIQEDQNYTSYFATPQLFTYYFMRRGFKFTDTCTISVLDDEGQVNDPLLDAEINLDLNIIYEPTTINVDVYKNQYTMDINDQETGMIVITNNGTNLARQVNFQGEWFTFSKNNFDLDIGDTEFITYTINPYLTATNQTDQHYNKTIMITGNFQPIESDFDIFINYAEINNQGNTTQSILDLIHQECSKTDPPDWCDGTTKVIYSTNGSEQDFNVTFEQGQVRGIFEWMFEQGDTDETFQNFIKDQIDQLANQSQQDAYKIQSMESSLSDISEKDKNFRNSVTLVAVISFFLFTTVLLAIYYKIKLRKKIINDNTLY